MKKGDAIEAVALPIAKALDSIFGTNTQNCSGCKRTVKNLNDGMSLSDAFYDRFWPKQKTTKKIK